MLAKILILCFLATCVVCNPIESSDDEDIPVYTEKVSPGKPTKPARIPRFESKKLALNPKKASENGNRQQPSLREDLPKVELTQRIPKQVPNTVVDNQYPRQGRALRKDTLSPEQSFASSPTLGVEYAEEEVSHKDHELVADYIPRKLPQEKSSNKNHELVDHYIPRRVPQEETSHKSHEEHGLIDDYTPRRPQHQGLPEYGTAAGNEPKLRYVLAPQRLYAAPANHRNDHVDGSYEAESYNEQPQPYIFGYELKDENGSTQSRKEQDDGYGNKRGSYGYTDGHGIYREVEYIADAHGFRAVVKTNEPGTENQNPADVHIYSEAEKY